MPFNMDLLLCNNCNNPARRKYDAESNNLIIFFISRSADLERKTKNVHSNRNIKFGFGEEKVWNEISRSRLLIKSYHFICDKLFALPRESFSEMEQFWSLTFPQSGWRLLNSCFINKIVFAIISLSMQATGNREILRIF